MLLGTFPFTSIVLIPKSPELLILQSSKRKPPDKSSIFSTNSRQKPVRKSSVPLPFAARTAESCNPPSAPTGSPGSFALSIEVEKETDVEKETLGGSRKCGKQGVENRRVRQPNFAAELSLGTTRLTVLISSITFGLLANFLISPITEVDTELKSSPALFLPGFGIPRYYKPRGFQ